MILTAFFAFSCSKEEAAEVAELIEEEPEPVETFVNGKILIKNRSLKVVDVAMQKLYLGTDFCSCLYVITEQYIVSIGMDGAVYVVKIYKDDE